MRLILKMCQKMAFLLIKREDCLMKNILVVMGGGRPKRNTAQLCRPFRDMIFIHHLHLPFCNRFYLIPDKPADARYKKVDK